MTSRLGAAALLTGTAVVCLLVTLRNGVCAEEASTLAKSLALDYWDESRFARFVDGAPLTVDERLEVARLVARLAGFDRRVYYASTPIPATMEQLRAAPNDYRGKLVRVQGMASDVTRPEHSIVNPDRPAPLARVHVSDPTGSGIVMAAAVPDAWGDTETSTETAAADGIFVKLVGTDDGKLLPLVAAPRLGWYPTQWNPPEVNYGMSVLGILGVDVASLDNIVQRQPLRRDETIAFYNMLAGMKETTASDLVSWAERHLPRHRDAWQKAAQQSDSKQKALALEVLRVGEGDRYSVAPFFNAPDTQVGQLAVFDGVVRRAVRVEVAGDQDAAAAGIDHYYELALFTDDSQNNPLMFAVLDIPPDFPLGDDVRVPVRIAGFLFKSWRYSSRAADDASSERLRVAPLFVGNAPLRIVAPPGEPIWGWVAGLGFLGVVLLLWLIGWRRAAADRAFAENTLGRISRSTEPPDFEANDISGDSE